MPADDNCGIIRTYFRIQRKDVALLKFILEGYEGLATVTTVNPAAAHVQISAPADFSAEVAEIIRAVQKEFSFTGFEAIDREVFGIKEAS
ncbi:MAG: DUF4911 domain-containing protein [Pseudomonadota bacterium]